MTSWLRAVEFASVFLAALSVAPALAHVFELPQKIRLSGAESLTH